MSTPFILSLALIPFLSGNLQPPGRYIWLPQTLLGPCTNSIFLTTLVVSVSGRASDPQPCQSLPSPGNSALGPTEQLSLWVAEAEGFRVWEQPFHQHMMKATIHSGKKKKKRSVKDKGQLSPISSRF